MTHKIIEGVYSKPEFETIDKWTVQEKIDGTNIVIHFHTDFTYHITGRRVNSLVPKQIVKYIDGLLSANDISVESDEHDSTYDANKKDETYFFAEATGPLIQKHGAGYSSEPVIVVFDIKSQLNDRWMITDEIPIVLAREEKILTAPVIGEMSLEEAIEFVKSKPMSVFAKENNDRSDVPMEGVVLKSPKLFENGNPIYAKLKVKDYQ